MQNASKLKIILITSICFLAFFLFGFTDNLKGSTLPAMLAELNINYATGGNIFFGEYFGFVVATMLTGIIADKFGLKSVLIFAGICLVIGVSGYSTFQNTLLLAISLFIIGLGLGAFELGPNAIIVEVYKERKGLFLNLMAVLHGLGSMAAPLFAGRLLSNGISWRTAYHWDLLLIALFLFLALILRFPKAEERTQIDFKRIREIAFKGTLPLFYFAIAVYVAAEIGVASWLVAYLQDFRGATVETSSRALSIFFGMLMIGRLIGGFFVHRFGYVRSILFAGLGASICLAVGTLTPLSFFLPLTGFFFSIIFPTITAAVSDEHTENGNTILGTLFTCAGLGGMIGPWVIGWASTNLGLQTGFLLNTAFTFLFFLSISYLIMKGTQHGKNT